MAESLEVSNLTAGYHGVPVVHGVTFDVRPGEIVALVGPNGAGKSTTLLTCSGLIQPIEGGVSFDGKKIDGLSPTRVVRRGVVQVPEDRALFPSLTVAENLRVASRTPCNVDVFDFFPELGELRSRRAGLLSGGEQQMLVLARALRCNPRLLLVDEMSMGLAQIIVKRLFSRLQELAHELGIGVLVVEQHVRLALEYVDRGYVMAGGRIVAQGSAEELRVRWSDIEDSYLGVSHA